MSDDLRAGSPFGHYRLVDLLGRGGQGEVWRAYDTLADRVVAVKVLPPNAIRDKTFVQRFRREAHAAARLNNAHVIPIHTHGEIDGRLYVDMRLIEGHDLQGVLARGPLEFERAVSLIEQMASALNAAHKVGLVHRDIKPSNILLDDDDFAYLIDFGIARTIDDTGGLTDAGAMIGTLQYMAPERMGGDQVDSRSDVYALACVLYECLTGSEPFPGGGLERQVAAHLMSPPPRPSDVGRAVPVQFDAVIAKGMAKNPDDRHQSAGELARAARAAATSTSLRSVSSRPSDPGSGNDLDARAVQTLLYPGAGPPSRPSVPDRAGPLRPHPSLPLSAEPPTQPSRSWWSRKAVVIPAAVLGVAAVAVAVVVAIPDQGRPNHRQSQLQLTGLSNPGGVAVQGDGTVYVTDTGNGRVLELKADAADKAHEVDAFADLGNPGGVAVDGAGTVYVCDGQGHTVSKLAQGAARAVVLPFGGLGSPAGVAANGTGSVVYVADSDSKVLELAGSTQTTLASDGLNTPNGVAVDVNGTVYVADTFNNRVLTWTTVSADPTELAFAGLRAPRGVAVTGDGTVYVTDTGNARVLKLARGSTQTELPFTGLVTPLGVAVTGDGTVYVTDTGTDKVIKLLPE